MQVVEEKAQRTPGKKSLAIEAYARALRAIPGTICDNAGNICTHPSSDHHEAVLQLPHAARCSRLANNGGGMACVSLHIVSA